MPNTNNPQNRPPDESKGQESILGLSTSEVAGLSVDELIENKTAITMLIHYYKKLVDDNNALKNEVNTLKTYVDAYQRKKTFVTIGATLLAASNILVGFGVNLLTTANLWPGLSSIIPGIALIAVGLYFSYKDVD
jgi:hypothetical protein